MFLYFFFLSFFVKKFIDFKGLPLLLEVFNESSKRVVILSHGFLSSKNSPVLVSSALALSRAGICAVRFNYATEDIKERVAKLKAVIRYYAKKGCRIGLVGDSLGGMTSIIASKVKAVDSMALINSVYDQETVFLNYSKQHRFLSHLFTPEMLADLKSYDLKKLIKRFKRPVLVVTSELDRTVPTKVMKELYLDVKAEKKIVVIRNATHGIWQANHIKRVREAIKDWFSKTL